VFKPSDEEHDDDEDGDDGSYRGGGDGGGAGYRGRNARGDDDRLFELPRVRV
jgi:hypothetical protein